MIDHSRIEHWHADDAPTANSLVPAAGVLAVDEQGRVLLQRRRDTGQWAIPMGRQEIGETPTACAVRETEEETGVRVEVHGLLGIFSDPAHVVEYTSDGEVRQEFEITFLGHPVGGEPTPNAEADAVRWVAEDEFDRLDIHQTMRRQLDAWARGTYPHFD